MPISRSRLRWGFVALLAAAIAAAVFVAQPRPMYVDPAVFIVIGRGIVRGQVPFLDLWDFKPPGTYLVGAVAWVLDPGDTTVSMQALSIVAMSVTATASGWLVSATCSRFWAGVATAVAVAGALSLPSVSYGGGETELFGVAGVAVCFAAIGGIMLNRHGLIWPAAAGAAFAWAIGCSVLTVAAVPAMALLWLSVPIDGGPYPLARSNWRSWIGRRLFDRRLAAAIAGAAVASLVVWWSILAGGALPAALDALLRYNALYSATGGYHLKAMVDGIEYLAPLWLPAFIVCLIPTARRHLLGFSVARSSLTWAAVLWLVAEVVLLVIGRRYYSHNMTLYVPPLALLSGITLSSVWSELPSIGRRAVGLALCAAVALGLGWQTAPGGADRRADGRPDRRQRPAGDLRACQLDAGRDHLGVGRRPGHLPSIRSQPGRPLLPDLSPDNAWL